MNVTEAATQVDPGKMARLAAVMADENVPSVVFQRLCDGETLKDIAKAWELPKGKFVEWYTVEHAPLYDAALKVLADELAHEALAISDEQCEVTTEAGKTYDPEVPRDKLRIDTRLKLASKWDRRRYGEHDDGIRTTPVIIQVADLRGATVSLPAAVKPAREIAEVADADVR